MRTLDDFRKYWSWFRCNSLHANNENLSIRICEVETFVEPFSRVTKIPCKRVQWTSVGRRDFRFIKPQWTSVERRDFRFIRHEMFRQSSAMLMLYKLGGAVQEEF